MSIVNRLMPLFAANAYAVRFYDEKRGKWNYRKVGRPLDAALITRHISKGDPEFSLGAYVLRDLENSKGHALILDLDDHDGSAGPQIAATALMLCDTLEEMALPYLLFRSGGRKGFHFYLLFEEPQTKSWLRALGKHLVCDKLGMAEGAKDVAAGEIEIFPKGASPGGENVIALPMARKSVALRRDRDCFVEAPELTEIHFCPVQSELTPRRDDERKKLPGYVRGALAELRQDGLPDADGYQGRVEISLDDIPVPVIGFVDWRFSAHGLIVDLKTTERLPSSIGASHGRQGAVYATAHGNFGMRFAYAKPAPGKGDGVAESRFSKCPAMMCVALWRRCE